ncbi:hypothetical protein H312_01205 [Anncaliia algerae PRA339]|uniref:Uncharacterized protein n=1 Tax=Anncaliia algerae PRA339 TaxID=1288291 RepID=A0A059F2X6_9MICR|nr:hypothetical protein H312_01205 [Anncaliia algerae PRA339]
MIAFVLLFFIGKIFTQDKYFISSYFKNNMSIAKDSNKDVKLFKNDEKKLDKDEKFYVNILNYGDMFLIEFFDNTFLFITRTHEIAGKRIEPDGNYLTDLDLGFKFEFIPFENGNLISSRGRCLEVLESDEILELTIGLCNPENIKQLFNVRKIKDVETEAGDEKRIDDENSEKFEINPIFHGVNSKRDPYMYGNEPYKGRY